MNLKQALKRIEELEARVKALESVKIQPTHFAPPWNEVLKRQAEKERLAELRHKMEMQFDRIFGRSP